MNEGASEQSIPEPQTSAEVFAKEAAEDGIKLSVGEAEKAASEGNQNIEKTKQEDIVELTNDAAPGLSKEMRNTVVETKAAIDTRIADKTGAEGVVLDATDIDFLANKFSVMGFRQETEDIDSVLKANNIPDKDITAIKAKLRKTDDTDRKNKEMSDGEATIKGNIAKQIAKSAESTAKGAEDNLQKELDKLDLADPKFQEKKEDIEQRKMEVAGLFTRFKQMFADGEPGKEWAIKIGKTLYYAFIIMFLFLIWEMNAIGKLGRTNNR